MVKVDYNGNTIDYRKLVKEEKKRARAVAAAAKQSLSSKNNINDQTQQPEDPTDSNSNQQHEENDPGRSKADEIVIPPWKQPAGGCQTVLVLPPLDRDKHCVCRHDPASIYYVPNVLSADWCSDLWNWLLQLPNHVALNDDDAANPRPGCWHALKHAQRNVALFDSTIEPFPTPLAQIVDALVQAGVLSATTTATSTMKDNRDPVVHDKDGPPNHILVNHYPLPTTGIMPHTDGPAYCSRTATISLGSGQVLLNFEPRMRNQQQQRQHRQVLLEGASLVVFQDEAYLDYMHSIADDHDDSAVAFGHGTANESCVNADAGTVVTRQPRMSLTIRRKKHQKEIIAPPSRAIQHDMH